MRFHFALTLWTSVCQAAQHYPAAWGHYDLCKFQIYTEEGLTWDYMACQPEAADMTQYLKVTLDPPNITCGDPPETYCALVSTTMTVTFKASAWLRYVAGAEGVERFVPIDVTFYCLESYFQECTALSHVPMTLFTPRKTR
ncbi:hypothetical protein JOQ06_018003 [Pogonophryne albipinna]|uniref:Uncharacterized protein n=1 Tax=Pogonophryne albipinna TaxID=1090488 RepID=A0AAD6AI89_9TELE|nr:hypothetical protein JOQ06_018003 [Pogonophryne albipinna]